MTRWGILPVPSLWAWDVEPEQPSGLEQHRAASSWFWVHFLFNEHRPALERFLRGLSEGEEPKAAWASAFADLAPQKMTDEAAAYIARQQTRGVGIVGRDQVQPSRPVAARNRGGR